MTVGREASMVIHLFRDETDNEIFALSVDVTGANLPPVTPLTEWIFLETIDTLRFPEPWDVGDFEEVLNHLRANGYYVFEGEFIEQPSSRKGRQSTLEC
jgi:hypothetical protein